MTYRVFYRLTLSRRSGDVVSHSLAAFIYPYVAGGRQEFPVFGKMVDYILTFITLIISFIDFLPFRLLLIELFFELAAGDIIDTPAKTGAAYYIYYCPLKRNEVSPNC